MPARVPAPVPSPAPKPAVAAPAPPQLPDPMLAQSVGLIGKNLAELTRLSAALTERISAKREWVTEVIDYHRSGPNEGRIKTLVTRERTTHA